MAKYKVTMTVTAEEFVALFPSLGKDVALRVEKVDPAPSKPGEDPIYTPNRRKRRTKAEMEAARSELSKAAE